ncbi:peptidylprolyl isomerase [Sagittula stellata]|uniref:Parvulin-like PPIase n=1 Tax=Sagittula stellata (strain ATCC 700073 / DSM 11524 / E-37) TaxID=388399 RepID=A3JZ68_SAGS3|nr:peptidylprolyl isomerase [Sagittula stellata]EBA09771.1 PPIC-type PPIASE domain [Sagittula stellata E-37]
MSLKTSLTAASLALGIALAAAQGTPVAAQGLFSPAVIVNEQVITGYELEQRKRMLQVMRAPGDLNKVAREQLIDDRLRLQAARDAGIQPSPEELLDGMEEFASRASLTREQFTQALAQAGVDEETYRDFVRAGLSWRMLVQQRFAGRANVSEDEVDRALSSGQNGTSTVRVLLSEIIMPMPPGQEEVVRERAQRIAQLDDTGAFSAQARRFSATASRGAGGQLPWRSLSELPPPLQPIVLGLAPGEVSDPIPLQGAMALFQLRAIEEGEYQPPATAAVEYAAYYIPGGRTPENLAKAQAIADKSDRCDDLYAVAQGQPPEVLDRGTLPVNEIPTDIAYELSKLDPGEVSTALTRADGQTLVLLMLCGRTAGVAEEEAPDREQVFGALRNQRIGSLADGYLAQLRSDATIINQ